MNTKPNAGSRASFGKASESVACAFLESLGYRIEGRNVRIGRGELDIVARDGDTLVFVEVKARRSARYGTAQEAVTPAKRARLCDAALAYLQNNDALDAPCRFDVVALDADRRARRITHFRDAFRCE